MIIGAHVSTAGGLHFSFDKAQKIGAQATQIFISPPQTWNHIHHSEENIATYLAKKKTTGIETTFTHGIYLINLATDNPDNLKKAIDWLIHAQKMAEQLEITGTIFHLGSHKGRGFEAVKHQVCTALATILEKSPKAPYLILENSAGAGGTVGGTIEELGELIKTVSDERLRICFDTQHAFASGLDLRSDNAIDNLADQIDRHIGLNKLVTIHTNDSKTELGSNRDRHENIGEGFIGKQAFGLLLNHPAFQNAPFVLEVPGLDDHGPDKANIDILKSLVTTI